MSAQPLPTFEPDFASPSEWAEMYRACGLQVVPAHAPDHQRQWKRPLVEWAGLQNEIVPDFTFERWYGQNGQFIGQTNMGVLTGRCSGNLLVIDLDTYKSPEAGAWWNGLMNTYNYCGEIETPEQITGGGGRQLLFRCPVGWEAPTNKTTLNIDLRGQGGFAVLPLSKHTSGRPYTWVEGRAPWEIEIAEAPPWLIEAVEDLVMRFGGANESGHGTRVATETPVEEFDPLSGKRIEGRETAMYRLIWATVVSWRREREDSPPEHESRARMEATFDVYLRGNASRLGKADGPAADLLEREGRGLGLFRQKWRYAMARWDTKVARDATERPSQKPTAETLHAQTAVSDADDDEFASTTAPSDPDPILDPWDAYVVPAFPFDVLPTGIQGFIESHSLVIGCDPSGLAMACLANFSGALDHRFAVKMMRNGNWWASPRLWVLLVGDPSRKKTPVIKAATHDLEAHQNFLMDQHASAVARHLENEGDEKDAPKPPPRFIVGDTTIEKLAEVLARHPRGCLIKRDELSGWVGAMERYQGGTGGADRAFWLQCYDGGPYTVDRIKRGELRVENLSTSFIGGIQPARLAEFKNLTSDGLLQRFVPVMLGPSELPEDEDVDEAFSEYRKLTRYLLSLGPSRITISEDGHRVAAEIRKHLHDLEHHSGGLASGFQAFVGKLQGIAGSLTLILHMLHDPEHGSYTAVSAQTMERVRRLLVEFILPHAYEFYKSVESLTDGDRVQKVASWILTSGKSRIVASDLTTNVSILRGLSLFDLNQRVSPLVAGGWLVPAEAAPIVRSWTVSPAVYTELAHRAEAEERRKQALADLMKASRKRRT